MTAAVTTLPWRVLARSIIQIVVVVAVLLTAYLLVPVHGDTAAVSAVAWAAILAVVTVVAVFVHQTRRITHSAYPLLAGAEALIIVLAIFLIGFAFVYLVMSTSAPDTFSEPLNRTGALYFAITVLSTVGFGDITPEVRSVPLARVGADAHRHRPHRRRAAPDLRNRRVVPRSVVRSSDGYAR